MTLLISIDRTLLGLEPLLLSGENDETPLGISDYREPARSARIVYAPSSVFEDGEEPLAMTWGQTAHEFDVFPTAATEADARSLYAELTNAISQGLTFPITITVGDAPAETWICNPGSIAYAAGRNVVDLREHNAVWSVSLPCHPVPTIA